MATDNDKFSPEETGGKVNPIGKIIASIIFSLLGGILVVLVFGQYKNIWVSSLIILAVGFILISIWNKNFYIYRYMLPAILILLVFTVYPISYTIYIAFTNFGTGHMQTKDEAKQILLSSKWTVDYNSQPLFAEFYAPQSEILEYMKAYEKAFKDFDYQMDKKKQSGKNEEFIETTWETDFYGSKQPELIKTYLGKLEKKDFTVIFYTKKYVNLDNTEDSVMADGQPIKVFLSENGDSKLKEISIDQISDYTKDKMLIGDTVFEREALNKAEKDIERANPDDDAESVMVSIQDFKKYYEGITDKYPFLLDNSEYLVEQANQFLSKRHTFAYAKKEDPNQLYYLNGETFEYDRKVFEDKKQGLFVLTVDNNPPTYWNDYKVTDMEYDYGALTLEKSSDAESYLEDKKTETDLESKINLTKRGLIDSKKIEDVTKNNADDLISLKKEIEGANSQINAFNKNLSVYKQDFVKLMKDKINSELPPLPESFDSEIFEKKVLSKIQNEEQKKLVLFYYRVGLAEENVYLLEKDKINDKATKDIWQIFISTNYFDIQKERNKKLAQLNATKFPKLSMIKLEKSINANIDRSVPVEPGYSVVVGLNNFKKIVTSRNITAPFLFVFIWTIIWAAFSVISSFAMGLALALVFNASDFKGKYIYRTLFILPYAIPAFVTVLMWNGFLNKDFGVINGMLKNAFHITENIPWTMDGTLAKISTLVVNLWLSFPYFMIISLGALQSIDSSMYEAADVDGATKIQQFTSITLPLLLIALGPMLVGSFAFAFNNFGGIYLLTGGGPTMAAGVLPGHTDILISYTFKLAFGPQDKDYGLASSIAIIVFMIIGTITFLNFKFTGTFKEVDNA